MAVIVNITAFSVTTDNEDLNASNTGWTKNNNATGGTQIFQVTNAASPNSAYPIAVDTTAYYRDETPGSGTQTVKAVMKRISTSGSGQALYLMARCTAAGDDWIGVAFYGDGTAELIKSINGSRTSLGGSAGMTAFITAAGNTGTIELVVTKNGTNNTDVQMFWTGTDSTRRQVGTTQNVTNSEVDGVGKVGLMARFAATTSTTGLHFTTFYAEDDSSGATGGGPLIGGLVRPILTRGRLVA